jgi:hypothetical protein
VAAMTARARALAGPLRSDSLVFAITLSRLAERRRRP